MTYQITINPTVVDNASYICRWHLQQTEEAKDDFTIGSGEIKTDTFSAGLIDTIVQQAISLCKSKICSKQKYFNLKFDLTPYNSQEKTINSLDLFALYGLLSTKLNPSTIHLPALSLKT